MDTLHFAYDYQKGTQALNYFALKSGGQINKMKAIKLVYFADRYHLRKYGRLITNDNYVAMKHGPVPSETLDIAEADDYLDKTAKDYSSHFIKPVGNLEFQSIASLDTDPLSDSDLEALEYAWRKFGDKDQFELAALTHYYPEWAKLNNDFNKNPCLIIDLIKFFDDPVKKVDKCFDLTEEEKKIKRDRLTELAHIESLWG